MKYIVLLGDGMADHAQAQLGGKTPLEVANIPTFDKLARLGEVGMTYTIPEGMAPGSDVANTAVLGYNPKENYSGRSPLEAVSMGIHLEDTDVTFRCNLVTLTDEVALEDTTILDHSAGEITSEEAKALILALKEGLDLGDADLYPGVSYRHCLVFHHAMTGTELPHLMILQDKRLRDICQQVAMGKSSLHSCKLLEKFLPIIQSIYAVKKRV